MLKVTLFVHEESRTIVSKKCGNCGEVKLNEDFTNPNGKALYVAVCKDCEEQKQQQGEDK
ncbi:hypothetical protein [Priestia endophytica]|uniref:hypothetical protein n=1 Tax=Priestia endophytica TaxID=135735 RepID=UPI00227DEB5B|nr:hypothetical protein [Priestia endophytica]MCY8233690.1 hypothetical protein [Priestia endophytica]